MEEVVKDICRTFTIQDLGECIRLLGIKIDRNRNSGIIKLSQPAYIDKIASQFNITPGKNITIPMKSDENLHNTSSDNEKIDVPYASIIGSVNYCSVSTCPDITFVVNKCSQFTLNSSIHHWQAAQQIIRHLLQTKNHGITFCSIGHRIKGYAHNLSGYSDADFASDVNDRKSTTGWIFTFNGTPISWASKKQTLVARLSMELELVAGSHAAVEGVWLIKLGNDFKQKFSPIPLFTNNQSFIIFSNNEVNNNHTKHINIHYFYTLLSVGIQTQWGTKGNIKEGLESTPMGSFDVGQRGRQLQT